MAHISFRDFCSVESEDGNFLLDPLGGPDFLEKGVGS